MITAEFCYYAHGLVCVNFVSQSGACSVLQNFTASVLALALRGNPLVHSSRTGSAWCAG
jgi:hypothetical protein